MNEWMTPEDCGDAFLVLSPGELRDALDELEQHRLIEVHDGPDGVRFRFTLYGMAQARKTNVARRRHAHHRRGKQ